MEFTANGTMGSFYATYDEIQSDFNLAQSLYYNSHFKAIRYPTSEDAALVCEVLIFDIRTRAKSLSNSFFRAE